MLPSPLYIIQKDGMGGGRNGRCWGTPIFGQNPGKYSISWKKGKDPHPQDKSQYLDFTKDPRPLYYKTPPCVFYHKNLRSKDGPFS